MSDAPPRWILLLDDDELWLRSLSRLLRTRGFEVRSFSSPEPALEALERDRPTLAVIDFVHGGGWTGATVARRIHGTLGRAAPPLVLVSGTLAEVEDEDLAIFDTVLSKGLKTERIVDEIAATLAEAEAESRQKPRSHEQLRPVRPRRRKNTPD